MADKSSDLIEIVALWRNTDKNGNRYYAGKITLPGEKTRDLLIFGKSEDASEGSPDFKFYLKPGKTAKEAPKGKKTRGSKREDDDIPF